MCDGRDNLHTSFCILFDHTFETMRVYVVVNIVLFYVVVCEGVCVCALFICSAIFDQGR